MTHSAPHPFAPLLTPEGMALLDSLPPYEEGTALSLGQELRNQGHDAALVAAALTQQRLRARATAKFGPFADRMLFTPDGLEQATRLAVSAHHAARYADAGLACVADLGCGIGGDALALAGLGLRVVAVERDEPTAALATVNLSPFEGAQVVLADALGFAGEGGAGLAGHGADAVFADPARRRGGKRLMDPRQWSPSLAGILDLRRSVEAVGVKVAPGIDYEFLPSDAHVQWVSVDGDVVEAALWCGPLALEGAGRSALLVAGERSYRLVDPACSDPSQPALQVEPIAGVEELGEFLFEPDGAVIRAGLVAHVAERLGARPVGAKIAYLTGNSPASQALAPFVRTWRIREVEALHLKALKARVKREGVGRLEIHKRGVDLSPEAIRQAVRPKGPSAETWVLTRLGAADTRGRSPKGIALIVEPAT